MWIRRDPRTRVGYQMGMQIGANWRIRWLDPRTAALGEMYKAAEPIEMQLVAGSSGLKEQCIE